MPISEPIRDQADVGQFSVINRNPPYISLMHSFIIPTIHHPHHTSSPSLHHPHHTSSPPYITPPYIIPTIHHPHHISSPPYILPSCILPTIHHPHHTSSPPYIIPTIYHPYHTYSLSCLIPNHTPSFSILEYACKSTQYIDVIYYTVRSRNLIVNWIYNVRLCGWYCMLLC